MRIYTLTLSPAFDIHCTSSEICLGRENVATVTSRCAGGKGINISRALAKFSVRSTACIALGEENAEQFCSMIANQYIELRKIFLPGRIRENITVHTGDGGETRLSFDCCNICDNIFGKIENEFLFDIRSGDLLTVTGRVPVGMDIDELVQLLLGVRERGVKLVIDSRSFGLRHILKLRPFLIKPNEEELVEYLDCRADDIASISASAARLSREGVENVMVTLGARGAILAQAGECIRMLPPSTAPVSTIGAGDSSIAGFIYAYVRGGDSAECLRRAISFGTAAVLTDGTEPPTPSDAERIYSEVKII